MRIYLSGPIAGHEETAGMRFGKAANKAANAAWKAGDNYAEIINPYEVGLEMTKRMCRENVTHAEYMAVSIALLSICDTIYMMSGWQQSAGCKQEIKYAKEHGYRILYQEGEP